MITSTLLLILLGELLALGALTLGLHRLSPRYGLNPLIFFLGGAAAALQFRAPGMLLGPQYGSILNIPIGSYVFLPALLLGLLIIYIVNGSLQARYTFIGLFLVSLLIASYRSLPVFLARLPMENAQLPGLNTNSPRIPFASAATLYLDMFVLVIVYQGVCNWCKRFPSIFACGVALMAALWCDTLVFPILTYLVKPSLSAQLLPNLIGRSIAGAVLWILAAVYLSRYSGNYPDSAEFVQRPALDIFTTQLQLERRASYHYNLLQTTNKINQLVVRSTDALALFEQTCKLLTERLDYSLAWIGLGGEGRDPQQPVAIAGSKIEFLEEIQEKSPTEAMEFVPSDAAIRLGKAIIQHIHPLKAEEAIWNKIARGHGMAVLAAFPMRYAGRVQGALSVYSRRPGAFKEEEELSLLQQLADDLAYAWVSLEARRQQAFLHTATENMRDGLLITDTQCRIIYANPAVVEMLKYSPDEINDHNIYSFLSDEQANQLASFIVTGLREEGQLQTEIEIKDKTGGTFFADLIITEVHNAQKEPVNFVINLRETTRRRLFEHKLLLLNRLTTELVQIYEPRELFERILLACEELLQADASAISLGDIASDFGAEIHTHLISESDHQEAIHAFAHMPGREESFGWAILRAEQLAQEPIEQEIKQRLERQGVQSLMLLPILYQGNPMGILGLYYYSLQQFDETIRQLGLTTAHTLAIALQNTRLYQSEHSQRQFAEAIEQASEALNSSLDLDLVLSQILEQTWRVVPCNSVNLMLVENGNAYVARQLFRSPEGNIESLQSGPTLPLTTPTLARMLNTGQPILISDTEQDPEWKTLETSSWIRCYASAPLQIRHEVIGFLNVNGNEPNYFNEETIRRLQVFASHAAAALHNARLYRDLQKYSLELESRVEVRTEQLSAAKNRIEAILESVPDAVFVLDNEGSLLESNQAGTLLLHQTEGASEVLFAPPLISRLRSARLPDEKAIVEIGGRVYQALSSPLPLSDQPAGLVVVFRDVTRFQELDRMKTQFVSDVSHELRTPLANLSLFLDLLVNEQNEIKRDRYQATLRRETNRLTELIEDLLTISRLESNRLSIQIKEVDVVALIQDLVEDRRPMAIQRSLELSFTIPDHLPHTMADPRLLMQVLSNILTNALNYTSAGGQIHLKAEREQTGEKVWTKISVSDNGFGIIDEELPHIFERFYRGLASRKAGASGTGLGLAISQEIVERMGGKITVESKLGAGSTFTVWVQSVL